MRNLCSTVVQYSYQIPKNVVIMMLSIVGATSGTDDVVKTESGLVRGLVHQQYRSFRGIPFAAAPIGKLRWAPPAPVMPWLNELNATDYRHNCMQPPGFDPPQPRSALSEDCLYLNVWTPLNASPSSSLPVFFWVHGGGYQQGGANESRLNGTWIAARYSVVVVTSNYRLGIFGFLASEELRSKDRFRRAGNYGILDQRAALQWVQRNIARFGGDPSRVLLVGNSAGGASVYNHLVRQRSWGLFSRAAAQSGAYTLVSPQPTVQDVEATYREVLRATACGSLSCLEAVDADTLVSVLDPSSDALQPVIDGVDLVDQISSLITRSHVPVGIPLLAGATRDDLGYPLWQAPDTRIRCSPDRCTEADFGRYVTQLAAALDWDAAFVGAMVEAYRDDLSLPGGNFTKWYWAAVHMGADFYMVCPARWSVRSWGAAHCGVAAAYMYLFAHVPDGPSGAYPHLSHHAAEIPFVFHVETANGPNAAQYHTSRREWPLADAMAGSWVQFAATGRMPSTWLPYEQNQTWLVFANDSWGTQTQVKRKRCDLWDQLMHSKPWATRARKMATKEWPDAAVNYLPGHKKRARSGPLDMVVETSHVR